MRSTNSHLITYNKNAMMLEVGQISSKIGTAVRSGVLDDKQVIQTTYDFQPILENHQPKQGQNREILTVRLMVRGRSSVRSRSMAPKSNSAVFVV